MGRSEQGEKRGMIWLSTEGEAYRVRKGTEFGGSIRSFLEGVVQEAPWRDRVKVARVIGRDAPGVATVMFRRESGAIKTAADAAEWFPCTVVSGIDIDVYEEVITVPPSPEDPDAAEAENPAGSSGDHVHNPL